MAKRAERRHHEERVKNKFRKVAEKLAGRVDNWISKWNWRREGNVIIRQHVLDRTGYRKRREYVDKQAAKMAHHPAHQCTMCKEDPKYHEDRLEFEANKKAPFDVE